MATETRVDQRREALTNQKKSRDMTERNKFGTKTSAEKMAAANRSGPHATVYDVRRDPSLKDKNIIRDKTLKVFPFVSGSKYKGEWFGDAKDGFGTQVNCDGSKYEGEWKDNKYHGRGTLWIKVGKKSRRLYVGCWANGKMEGEGTYFYDNGEIYTGEWMRNKRSGKGRLDYTNGDYYEGEWANDSQQGIGSLYHVNGNVYSGLWMNGMKEGPGKFFYAATQKVYEGEWAANQPCCGEYRAPTADEVQQFRAPSVRPQPFDLPALGLENAKGVLNASVADVRLANASRRGLGVPNITQESLERAKIVFMAADVEGTGLVSMWALGGLFMELGISLTTEDTTEILQQLELGGNAELSFPEAIDIATFLLSGTEEG